MATRWLDRSQPQTLYGAVTLMYFNAALALIYSLAGFGLFSLVDLLLVVSALGISNDKRWAYWLGVGLSVLALALSIYSIAIGAGASVITLLFQIVLVALLLHPQSREYQRIWFK